MDTLTVLREARRILEDEGRRTNKTWICEDGRCCIAGACAIAAGYSTSAELYRAVGWDGMKNVGDEAVDSAVRALAECTGKLVEGCRASIEILGALSVFNHTPSNAEVLALFDRAIAAEEAKLAPPEIVSQATPRRRDDVGCETRERVTA